MGEALDTLERWRQSPASFIEECMGRPGDRPAVHAAALRAHLP
jgi:hypothetical protein